MCCHRSLSRENVREIRVKKSPPGGRIRLVFPERRRRPRSSLVTDVFFPVSVDVYDKSLCPRVFRPSILFRKLNRFLTTDTPKRRFGGTPSDPPSRDFRFVYPRCKRVLLDAADVTLLARRRFAHSPEMASQRNNPNECILRDLHGPIAVIAHCCR